MKNNYEKPCIIIKNYKVRSSLMVDTSTNQVYDAGAAGTIQYTLGTLNS